MFKILPILLDSTVKNMNLFYDVTASEKDYIRKADKFAVSKMIDG